MKEELGARLLCWLFLVKHPFTSQQEVFLYIPAKSPLFHLKVRIGLSQIKDAIKTFPALDETLYLHADRALYKTPGGLFIYFFMEWEMKVRWLLQGLRHWFDRSLKCNHGEQLLRHVTMCYDPTLHNIFSSNQSLWAWNTYYKPNPLSLDCND